MAAKSFAGLEFDKSQTLANGDTLHVLVLRDAAVEIVLATIWLQLMPLGLLGTVWPGGIPKLSWLIAWAAEPVNRCFGCFLSKSGTDSLMIVGLGWAIGLTKVGTDEEGKDLNKAEVGMVFYPAIQRTRMTHEFADMMITWGFENLGLTVLYGTTPSPNVLACRFALRAGFKHVGTFPDYGIWNGKPASFEIHAVTKKEWFSRGVMSERAALAGV